MTGVGDIEVTSDGARLAVTMAGEGPPVVLLHAGVADRRCWESIVPRFLPEHRVISYDRRGFGDSVWKSEPYSHVADAMAVLESCAQEKAVLIGNSQGGRIAIDLALAHPERVRGLVLVGTAVTGAPPPEVFPPAICDLLDRIATADREGNLEEVNRLEAHVWLDGPGAPEHRVTGPPRELFLQMNGRALSAPPVGEETEPPDAYSRLHQIHVPTLVLVGMFDFPHIIERSEIVAEVMPRVRLERLDDSAHLPSLDQPEALADVIVSFVRTLDASS